MAPGSDAAAIADAINQAEAAARATEPDMTLVMYLEPDIDLGPAAAASAPAAAPSSASGEQ